MQCVLNAGFEIIQHKIHQNSTKEMAILPDVP